MTIPTTGYLRLKQVLALIPVSRSTWWSGVKSGRYPQPTRALGQRITAWRAEDIHALIGGAAVSDAKPRVIDRTRKGEQPDREAQIQHLQWLLGRVCAHIGMDPNTGTVDASRKRCEVNDT